MCEFIELPKCKDSERSVGFVTRVATQVASPEVIAPDVAQGCCWFQVLQHKHKNSLLTAFLRFAGIDFVKLKKKKTTR